MMPPYKVMTMTKDEVIEAFSKGLVVKDRESGKMGEILMLDATDSTAHLKDAQGWRKWADLELPDPEVSAQLKIKAEKVKAALDGLLLKAPRVQFSDEKMEEIREERRGLEVRLIAMFPSGKALTVSISADGQAVGYSDSATLSDFTLIED